MQFISLTEHQRVKDERDEALAEVTRLKQPQRAPVKRGADGSWLEWYSLCSAHYYFDPECPRCLCGQWGEREEPLTATASVPPAGLLTEDVSGEGEAL